MYFHVGTICIIATVIKKCDIIFRFVQGYGSKSCYHFQHWHLINSFCYFSHNFVTIPPPGWTNAAHTNGVKVLGTIITEWEDGAALCMELLQSEEQIQRTVNILVEMAEYYGFEGWLVNIENEITVQQHIISYYITERWPVFTLCLWLNLLHLLSLV